MAALSVTVIYTDGTRATAHPSQWSMLRSEGVDKVLVSNRLGVIDFAGHSFYWCRRVGDEYAFGAASFYENNRGPEIHFSEDTQRAVPLHADYVPNLTVAEMKLGWWRNGSTGDKYEGESWRAFTT